MVLVCISEEMGISKVGDQCNLWLEEKDGYIYIENTLGVWLCRADSFVPLDQWNRDKQIDKLLS